jgi:hypothetical protein
VIKIFYPVFRNTNDAFCHPSGVSATQKRKVLLHSGLNGSRFLLVVKSKSSSQLQSRQPIFTNARQILPNSFPINQSEQQNIYDYCSSWLGSTIEQWNMASRYKTKKGA